MKPSQKGIPKKQYTLVQRAIMVHHWSKKSRKVRKATFLANNPDVDEDKLGAWCRENGVNMFLKQLLDDKSRSTPIFEEETIQWIDEKGSIICLDDIDREYRMNYCLTDDIRFTKKNDGLLNVKRSTGLVSPKPIQNSVTKMKQSIDKNFFLPKNNKKQKVALINMDSDTESEIVEPPTINVQEKNPTNTTSMSSEITVTAVNIDTMVHQNPQYFDTIHDKYEVDLLHENNEEENLKLSSSSEEVFSEIDNCTTNGKLLIEFISRNYKLIIISLLKL
jgi:hypothetical protein